MEIDPLVRLKDYLKSPSSPTWSSQGLKDLFNSLNGTMLDKQQIILPIIDEKLSSVGSIMTEYQFNFIRDVTLHAHYPTRVNFTKENLKWLLDRFDTNPTQHRAILIYILLEEKYLSLPEKQKIIEVLKGSFAAAFIHFDKAT